MKKKILYGLVGIMCVATMLCGCGKNKTEETTEPTETSTIYEEVVNENLEGNDLNITTDSGDVITLSIDDKKEESIKYNGTERLITIVNKDGNTIQSGCFLTAKWYKQYYDAVKADCEIIEEKTTDETTYIYYTYKNSENNTIYEILGWIIGSNSGFVMEGTDDKDETMNIFKQLNFTIKETSQEDKKFILDPSTYEIPQQDYEIIYDGTSTDAE